MNPDELTIAAGVREACIEAALAGYEDASISGLCGEGALEVAISAMRRLDLNETLESLAKSRCEDGSAARIDTIDHPSDESFISTRPATIRTSAKMRRALADSPSTSTPTKNAPTAPIPVHIV